MKHLTFLIAFLFAAVSSFGQAPTDNATDPPARDSENVISIFSGAYTDVSGSNYNPNWGQSGFSTANTSFDPGTGNIVLAYPNFNYQGNVLGSVQDISSMEFMHVDIWVNSTFNPNVFAISSGAEIAHSITNTGARTWISVDIPISGITGDPTQVKELKFDGGNGSTDSIYVDNIYFWKNASTPQSDATLSDLKVDGETIANFSAGVESYKYGLVAGTTTVPQITAATSTNANATVTITQASGIPGDATVKVVSEDETDSTTYTVSYAITSPATAAPAPTARDAADVISIYSDAYTNIALDALSAGFDDSDVSEVMIDGNATLEIDFTNFIGIDFSSNKQDASTMTHFHMDFWTASDDLTGKVFNSKFSQWGGTGGEVSAFELPINTGTSPAIVSGSWVSIDVPISDWTNAPQTRDDIAQFLITSNLDTVYVDNIYLYKEEGVVEPGGELLTNGDFESGDDGSWFGNAFNIQTEGGNSFNFADVATAGNAFDVNLSQGVPIIQGETYILTFDASTSAGNTRSILAGIGLNEGDFSSATEAVNLTETTQTFVLELTASGFGSANSRVLFDMGAETGIVVIDNVTLDVKVDTGGELLTNGDFELGDDGSWFGNAFNIQTEGGNSFNFADVATAGNAFDVNLSNGVAITQGETYILTFEASTSPGNTRSIIAGIGLNEGNFTAATETVNLTETNQTFVLKLTATDFGSANSRVLFDMGAETGIVVIDNVSLIIDDGSTADPAPMVAAPAPPQRNAEDVISLYSDAYTDIELDTLSATFDDSFVEQIMIEGDNTLKIDFTNFVGVDFSGNKQDASEMTHFHLDFWTAEEDLIGKVFNLKFSQWGGTDGEVSAFELPLNTGTSPAVESGKWISVDVPISDWTNTPQTRDDIAQFLITSNLDVVYVDNVYLYKGMTVSIEDPNEVPATFALDQNYPNPFNPSTNISYSIPENGKVSLEVYNIQGQKVTTLVNEQKSAGSYTVTFDASNLASGVYMYRLVSKNSVQVRKMLLIK